MEKRFVNYKNGNYTVCLDLKTGTKIKYSKDDNLLPTTVDSMDIKITNSCSMGCSCCHEASIPRGKHADLFAPSFLDKLHPYTELAIGGGNILEHPDLLKFLQVCKERNLICNATFNQVHFMENIDLIRVLVDRKMLYGIGVSLVDPTPEFISTIQSFPTAVIHVINGLVTEKQLRTLANNNLKILILGYKEFRRGKKLYEKDGDKIEAGKGMLYDLLPTIRDEGWFDAVSFDNLSLKQLDVKRILSNEEWEEFYMGDDGLDKYGESASMYVDLVERKFAENSTDPNRYDLLDNVEDMFKFLYDKCRNKEELKNVV